MALIHTRARLTCATLAALAMVVARDAHAETCTYESRDAATLGLPVELVGPAVSIAHCTGDSGLTLDRLHAGLRLGILPPIEVSGPYLGAGACLGTAMRAEVWPGFAPDLSVRLCRDAAGAWTPRVDGRVAIPGGELPFTDAAVEYLAGRLGPVRLRLPRLALGPFALDGATILTAIEQGRMVPRWIEGSLRWNDADGGELIAVAGYVGDDAIDLGVAFSALPPDFPFPGVTLPPLSAHLAFKDGEWRLFVRADGAAQLGPLGSVGLAGSELEVRFRDGEWAMAGCLAAELAARDLGVVRVDDWRVEVCGLRAGVDVEVGGRLGLPALGITGAAVGGSMHWDAGAWAVELDVDAPVALGPFGDVTLGGHLSLGGTAGAVTVDGCLRGDGALSSLAGLAAELRVSVGRCASGDVDPRIAVAGSVTLPGGSPATVDGTLVLGSGGAWSLSAEVDRVALGPFAIEHATLTADPTSGAALAGDFQVGPFALRASGHVAPGGPFALAVDLRAPAVLGGGVTVIDAAGSKLEWTGSVWRLVLDVGVAVDAGPFGTVTAHGDIDASWNPGTGSFAISGCVSAALAGMPADLTAEVCFADGAATFGVHGVIGGVDVAGSLVTGPAGSSFDLAIAGDGALVLAPGVVVEDVRFVVRPGGAAVELHGRLCVGALCLEITGTWIPDGRSTLTATLTAGTPWQPFAALPGLRFTGGATGTLVVDGSSVTLDVRADSTSSVTLAPGFTLDSAFATGHLATGDGAPVWSVALGGTTTVAFGDDSVSLTASGSLDSTGRWTLTGTSPGRFEPLAALIGAGRFVVAAPTFTVDVPAGGGPAITLSGDLELCLIGSCAPGRALTARLRGGLVSAPAGVWFAANLPGLSLPGFGSLDAAFAASTVPLPGFDLLNTPADTTDDLAIAPGLTISALIDLPVRLGPQPTRARLVAHVQDLLSMSLRAGLDLHLPLVKPEHKLPGISELSLESVALVGSIDAGVHSIGVEASARFVPSNQPNPLLGTAALSMSATGDLGVDLSIAGRWYDPFGLPRIAIQNPAFALSINVSSSLPIPSRLGWNGDFFWLKSGTEWPSVEQWPLPTYGVPAVVPSNIMALGGTFYFDAIPSPSGLCIGVCVPLPAVIVRFELHNLGVADLVKLAGDVKTGVKNVVLGVAPAQHQAALAGLFPDGAFTAPVPAPLDVTVNDLELYLSTHNLMQWGMSFSAGFRAVVDVTAGGRHAVLRGVLDDQGLLLEGRLSPISVFGVTLGGDQTRRIATPAAGTITVADDARLTPASATVEGHVLAPAAGGTLASKLSGTRGWRVRLRPAVQVCASDGSGCRSLSPVEVTAGNGGATTVITTSAPAVPPGEWHHVAVTWGTGGVRVFVDGASVATTATAAQIAPTTAAIALTIGTGLTHLDDVRVWNVARTAAEISRDAGFLPPAAYAETRLVARYAFDFDRAGTPANNQRLLPTGTPALHGTYGGGAAAASDPRDAELSARLRLALPGAGASGFTTTTGVTLDIPALGGPRVLGASVAIGDGQARGQFHMAESSLMTLPGFGALYAGGRGPNLVANDFDDGVFGTFDVAAKSLSASAGLYFRATPTSARQTLIDGALSWLNGRLTVDGTASWSTTLPGGAPMTLVGQGKYDSATGVLAVNGSLAVFGHTLSASSIKVSPSGIALRSSLDLSAFAPVALGSTTLDLSLAYSPARLCGNATSTLSLPALGTPVTGQLGVCIGASPSLSFDGSLPQLTVGGISMTGVRVTYSDAAGLKVAGDVSIPGVFTGRMSGSWTSTSQFQLDATASISLAGFSMSNAALKLTPTGFRATGTLDLGLWRGTATVSASSTGTYLFKATTDASIAGFTLDAAALTLTQSGMQVAGTLQFLGNNIAIDGAYYSDGAYRWSTTATVRLSGFSLGTSTVTLANYTTAHPRTFLSWPLSGLRVDGSLALLGGTLDVVTRIDPVTGFSVTASPSLNVSGFALTSTSVTLSSASGLSVRGSVRVGSTYVVLNGTLTSLSSYELCSATGISANAASGLPDLRGQFCLERTSTATTLNGSGKAIFWGNEFSTTFRISSTGGIDYLFVDVPVARFDLLGVSATGRMKLKVEDNDLVYVRWYGSLFVPSPVPGWAPILDFDSHINLSAFRLCPSHFGVDPTAWGLPSGCVDLDF